MQTGSGLASAARKIRYTRYAHDKFKFLGKFGLVLSEDNVKEAIVSSTRFERRNDQLLSLRPIDREYTIRAIYRVANDNMVVVTFQQRGIGPEHRFRYDAESDVLQLSTPHTVTMFTSNSTTQTHRREVGRFPRILSLRST